MMVNIDTNASIVGSSTMNGIESISFVVVQCTGNCDPCWHAQAFNTQTLQRFDFHHKYSKIYCEIMSTLCKIMWNLQKSQTRSEILQPIPSVVCRLPCYVFCTWVDLADQLFISSSLFIHCNVLILLHNALRKSSPHNREEIICDARGSILDEDNRSYFTYF